MNVDTAIFSNRPNAGYGCVLRDDQRTLVDVVHGSISCYESPTNAEALRIREPLS